MNGKVQLYRTVEGVRLVRSAPDVWVHNGWSFRFTGMSEWWVTNPQGETWVAFSLAGAVQLMKAVQAREV